MRENIKILYDIPVTMRDGTVLYCDVYRPDNEKKYPAIVNRTPYLKDNINPLSGYMHAHKLAARGYNVVIQDVRGSANSEGILDPSGHQDEDGFDTIEAIAAMEWCDGNVGMMGESYHGFSQLAAARAQPPHLKAICPFQTSWTKFPAVYGFGIFSPVLFFWIYGRAFDNEKYHPVLSEETKRVMKKYLKDSEEQLRFRPLKDMPAACMDEIPMLSFQRELLENITSIDYLKEIGRTEGFEQVQVPAFELTGWNDFLRDETIYNYVQFKKRGGNERVRKGGRLIVGPWQHGDVLSDSLLGQYFGEEAGGDAIDISGKIADWYDFWIKGKDSEFMSGNPVHLFVMGINQWRTEKDWPVPDTCYKKMYLHSEGHSNTMKGDGRLSWDRPGDEPEDCYTYDPDNPVPSEIKPTKEYPYAAVTQDQRVNENRDDVLVYTTEPLNGELEIIGPVEAYIYASSSAADTDYVCKLIDVWEDGTAFCLMKKLVRARYRNGRKEELLEPGKIYEYRIPVGNTAIVLKKGHALRMEITSSLFPDADCNLNTGGRAGYEVAGKKAEQKIFHCEEYPSCIVLPVGKNVSK